MSINIRLGKIFIPLDSETFIPRGEARCNTACKEYIQGK